MSNAKTDVKKLLDVLPEDVTLEDIQYHIYVREKIEQGLHDIALGHTVSQEEMQKRMSAWLGK